MRGGRVEARRGSEEEAEGCCEGEMNGKERKHKSDDAVHMYLHTSRQGGEKANAKIKQRETGMPSLSPSLLALLSLTNTSLTQGILRQGHLHAALHALLLPGRAHCV